IEGAGAYQLELFDQRATRIARFEPRDRKVIKRDALFEPRNPLFHRREVSAAPSRLTTANPGSFRQTLLARIASRYALLEPRRAMARGTSSRGVPSSKSLLDGGDVLAEPLRLLDVIRKAGSL